MSGLSKIEWTTATWNPVTGCTKVSPGCDHCYAETFAERWRGIPDHAYEQGFDLTLRPERLDWPLKQRKPLTIFVNSMSDLFHADVPEEYIGRVFDTMHNARQHTYQVLTKRAERMERVIKRLEAQATAPPYPIGWPPAHVWLGVSVESPTYYGRIRHLQRTPVAVRFLSCEPLLAPLPDLPLDGIQWVIVGGESGPGARPMHPAWVRDIRDQCQRAGVPFFFKQWGTWAPAPDLRTDIGRTEIVDGGMLGYAHMRRLGKAAAGRTLDGRTWDEMPAFAAAVEPVGER